jgi:hypothetical protein
MAYNSIHPHRRENDKPVYRTASLHLEACVQTIIEYWVATGEVEGIDDHDTRVELIEHRAIAPIEIDPFCLGNLAVTD